MQGVIAAGHPETAAAGAEILRQGGNAVDAAVAAAFASFITEAVLVNIGGGGIAMLYDPQKQTCRSYDFFSNMPGLGQRHHNTAELDFRRILIDFGSAQQPFYIGRGSVAVPGVVAGLGQLVADCGTMPLSKILAPAIRLARDGIILNPALEYVAHLLTPILTDTPEIRQVFAPNGEMITHGERLRFPALADTLKQLGRSGPELFYHGAIAEAIVADQKQHHGLMTTTDLAEYQVQQTAPISIEYRGFTVLLPPPSSIGGVLIAFALKLLSHFPLDPLQPNSFKHLQLLIEVMRLANISRGQWMSLTQNIEPTSTPLIIEQFLSEANIAHYANELKERLKGNPAMPELKLSGGPNNTTHLTVADADGMVVSITTSAGENAGFMVDNSGIMLNNMLGEIDLHPEGFHRLPAGHRLTTMMTPVIVLHEGAPILALGSGGSNRIRSAILQTISNIIDFKLPLQEAVDAPRIHFEDEVVQLEGGISSEIADQLEAKGYQVNRWSQKNMFFGGAHAVAQQSASWVSAGDARRGGSVMTV